MLRVTCRHLSPRIEGIVRDWFAGSIKDFARSGERSVTIPLPGQAGHRVKIKGAGFRGGPIQFGNYLARGPVAPLFDFDGRRMLDVASSHDGAYVGGCSHQQAAIEWAMTHELQRIGHACIPCLGYGSVTDGAGLRSWFTVFAVEDAWIESTRPPAGTIADYRNLALRMGRIITDLAVAHSLIGFAWMVRDGVGGALIKDLHPFHRLDPINQSRQAWVMQTLFALHMIAINSRILCDAWYGADSDPEAPLWVFRMACPEATPADWDSLRFKVVAPYMLRGVETFNPDRLADLLEAHRISAALASLCPPDYAPLR